MKIHFLLILSTSMSILGYAQIKYESGYYITNSGKKINCLIKNLDWKNNPTHFSYKLSENSQVANQTIDSIAEFGIFNETIFKRFKVGIDRSNEATEFLSSNNEPIFNSEIVFLKILVEGKATLYYYEDGDLYRYFYTIDSTNVKQLVFKSYLLPNESYIKQNTTYKQQILRSLQSPTITVNDILPIEYNFKDLTKIFKKYNHSYSSSPPVIETISKIKKSDIFNLNLKAGISIPFITLFNPYYTDITFKIKLSMKFGAEAEFILPFNRNKWALILEPSYQHFKTNADSKEGTYFADLKFIELPFGIRHSLFLNDNSKLFVNGTLVTCLDAGSSIKLNDQPKLDETQLHYSTQLGFGYAYKKKYSAELRYGLKRGILDNYKYWSSNFSTVSLILGYQIF